MPKEVDITGKFLESVDLPGFVSYETGIIGQGDSRKNSKLEHRRSKLIFLGDV